MTSVAITGAGLVTPAASSVDGLLSAPPAGGDAPGDWFDPVAHLGARGWKYLTPATRFLLAAAGRVLADARLDPGTVRDEAMGVVVGTNFAANPVVARLDAAVIAEGATWLSPAEAPNFSVNIPASEVGRRYGMRAFNITLTNPVVAGLESVLLLASAIRRGRARLGIAGATEERPDEASGEGACCLTLEAADAAAARDAPVLARVVGGFSRFIPPGQGPKVLAGALEALLRDAGEPLPCVLLGGDGELAGVARASAGVELAECRFLGADGRYATVSALLQAIGLLAVHRRGLVLAASPHGHLVAVRLG